MISYLGGGIDRERERARREQRGPAESSEGPQVGAEGGGLRGGLPNLQSSPASWPQTSLQDALGDLNSPANYLRQADHLPTKS